MLFVRISRDPDKIYDLFDDIAGQQELAKEAVGALSTSIYGQDIDEVIGVV